MKTLDWVKKVTPYDEEPGQEATPFSQIYGGSKYNWTVDNFGPITVPKEGVTVQLDEKSIAIYGTVIKKYEGNENVEITEKGVSVGGKPISSYTFKQDYY
ncbi:MAG: signal peptidase I, partial [Sphingobacteriales bacterium]